MSLVVGFNVNDGNVLIPDGVKIISHSAFYGRNSLKKVILSESVELIEFSAFAECLNVEYVYLNDHLKCLEGLTFHNCISLKEVVMPTSIDNIGEYIFWQCESLEQITLPNNIDTIPRGMFDSCKGLTTVNTQSVITSIENSAFYNCKKLTYFDLTNVQTIGNDAFSWCKSLTEIDLRNVKTVLDVGCGYGTIGVTIAKIFPSINVTMVDVNKRAINLCELAIKENNLTNAAVLESNIYENITSTYDLIITNPPIRAGKQVVHGIILGSYDYLNDGGALWCVIQKKQGSPSAIKVLKETFKTVEVVQNDKGYQIIKAVK